MIALGRDLQVIPIFNVAHASLTAGGTGDNTAVNGASIDGQAQPAHECFSLVVAARAVLAATKKLTVAVKLQDSDDGSAWTDVTDFGVKLTLTGGSGGTTEVGAVRVQSDANKLRRYRRWVVTPDLDAANTDTAVVQTVVLLSGLHVSV